MTVTLHKELKEFLKNVVSSLCIIYWKLFSNLCNNEGYKNPSDPIQQAIVKVESFSSILII